jgi:hypothetical protein
MYGKGRINLEAQNISLGGIWKNGQNDSTVTITTPNVDLSQTGNVILPIDTKLIDNTRGEQYYLSTAVPKKRYFYPGDNVYLDEDNLIWIM